MTWKVIRTTTPRRRKQSTVCRSKRRFPTVEAALDALKHYYFKDGEMPSLYECPECLDFHITHWKREAIITHVELRHMLRAEALQRWFPHWKREHVNHLITMRTQAMTSALRKKLPFKITGNKKQNTLPLSYQKELLRNLNNL